MMIRSTIIAAFAVASLVLTAPASAQTQIRIGGFDSVSSPMLQMAQYHGHYGDHDHDYDHHDGWHRWHHHHHHWDCWTERKRVWLDRHDYVWRKVRVCGWVD